jgi:peptide/nickel transport system permease protein
MTTQMIRNFLNIIRRNKFESLGLLLVLIFLIMALFGPLFAPYSPTALNLSEQFQPPSLRHWFGTDANGRDIVSRTIVGARLSLTIAFWVISVATVIGGSLGIMAGFWGGLVDESVMRLADVFLAFPSLILAMAIAAALGTGLTAVCIGLAATWWPGYARLLRSRVLVLRQEPFVESARAIGCSAWRIILRHIIPNALSPLIVQITLDVGYVILAAAGLGFIGLGVQPPTPEWGVMIAAGREYILSKWWISTFPGVALFATVLGFNLSGDLLRNELDPLTRRRAC